MAIAGLTWLWFGIRGFRKGNDDTAWARKMFFISLVCLLIFCLMISINSVL
jgi:heme O synthase-like polyprenyltransferase